MRHTLLGGLALAVLSFGTVQAHATEYIVNGGFETGTLAGFTKTGGVFLSNPGHTGTYAAVSGSYQTDATLSQTFSDIAGQMLTVSFYMANDPYTPNDFSAKFDGTTLLSLTNFGGQGYTLYSYAVTATGSDTLTFGFRQDSGVIHLDDVSVASAATPTSVTPEPSSFALLGTGLLGAAGAISRRLFA